MMRREQPDSSVDKLRVARRRGGVFSTRLDPRRNVFDECILFRCRADGSDGFGGQRRPGIRSRYSITDKEARVNYPASDPLVTAVGGTALSHIDGTSFEERPWSSPQGGATGGGVSAYNPVPAWQTGAGVPQSVNPGGGSGRGVPDIAGNAADASPYALVFEGKVRTLHGERAPLRRYTPRCWPRSTPITRSRISLRRS